MLKTIGGESREKKKNCQLQFRKGIFSTERSLGSPAHCARTAQRTHKMLGVTSTHAENRTKERESFLYDKKKKKKLKDF